MGFLRLFILCAIITACPGVAEAFQPLAQTAGEVTIKVTGAGWEDYNSVSDNPGILAGTRGRKALVVAYTLTTPNPILGEGPGGFTDPLEMNLVLPDGRRVPGMAIKDRPGCRAFLDTANQAFWVDPRWPVHIECAYRLAKPKVASGDRQFWRMEFNGVAVPRGFDRPVTIGQSAVAGDGVRIYLDSVTLIADAVGDMYQGADVVKVPRLVFAGRWVPPDNNPGLCPQLWVPRGSRTEPISGVQDDLGNDLVEQKMSSAIYPASVATPADSNPGHFAIYAMAPPLGTHSLTVRVEVWEQRKPVPDQPLPFQFDIPTSEISLPLAPPTAAPIRPLATAALGDGKLILEYLAPVPGGMKADRWEGRILLQAAEPQSRARQWVNRSFSYTAGPGQPAIKPVSLQTDVATEFWKLDGTPISANECYFNPVVSLLRAGVPSSTDITTHWQELERKAVPVSFKSIPVPRRGETIDCAVTDDAGRDGKFVVRKVGWFDPQHGLTPAIGRALRAVHPPFGMAVLIEHLPGADAPAPIWNTDPDAASWLFDGFVAADSTGRDLLIHWPGNVFGGAFNETEIKNRLPYYELKDLFTENAPENAYFMTVFVLSPAADAKTFDLSMTATHVLALHDETVTFPGVPLAPLEDDNG